MSQFRLARLCLILAALGAGSGLMNNAFAQKDDKAPAAAEQKGPTIRPELFKLIDPAAIKQLMDAKNFTEVQNRLAQGDALPDKTPYETYAINRMKLSLGASSNNDALTIPALESVIDSGFLQPAEKDNFIQALGDAYYRGKNYPKAIEWLKRYQKEGATPEKMHPTLVRAYYLSDDYGSAKNELLPMIAAAEKAGKTPSQEDLKLLASSANELNDDPTYLMALEKLAVYYPTDAMWNNVLSRGVIHKAGFDSNSNLINLFRLQYTALQKMPAESSAGLAELALQAGFPTEAKKVLDKGFETGELGKGPNAAQHRQLRDKANKAAADDAKNIAKDEAAAGKAKNGAGLVNLGWAYVTMDQFDKGIGFIQQGISKGGLKQPDEAKLRLGMAYARAGRKDEAIKTFESVKARGGLSDLAKYWILLLNKPAQVAAK